MRLSRFSSGLWLAGVCPCARRFTPVMLQNHWKKCFVSDGKEDVFFSRVLPWTVLLSQSTARGINLLFPRATFQIQHPHLRYNTSELSGSSLRNASREKKSWTFFASPKSTKSDLPLNGSSKLASVKWAQFPFLPSSFPKSYRHHVWLFGLLWHFQRSKVDCIRQKLTYCQSPDRENCQIINFCGEGWRNLIKKNHNCWVDWKFAGSWANNNKF